MENKRPVGGSSSSYSLDHLFGPKDSSSSSSSSTGLFGSIFPPPSMVLGRDSSHSGNTGSFGNQIGNCKYATPDKIAHNSNGGSSGITKKDNSSIYEINETVEPCIFSSSIYYGGQENYSPRTRATESHPIFKKDGGDDDPNGSNSNSTSRGNWWKGSLYY